MESSNDVRFRVHVVLETGTGERIAEIQFDDMILELLAEMPPGIGFQFGMETNVDAVRRIFESRLTSPLRGCVRAFLARREQKPLFARLDERGDWPDDGNKVAMLKESLDFHRELMLESSL